MKLSSLSVGYKGSAPIVKAIEAELSCGEFICLLGRNGSGKSTLLRTLAGLHPPISGSLLTSHSSLQTHPSSRLISIVTPHFPDLQHTTVHELVVYGRLPHTGLLGRLHTADHQAAERAIQMVGIEAMSQRLVHTLSDGEKQKALIARALAQDTPILLLDEPSAFLDYPSRRQLMELLVQLAHVQHKAILLSTHDVELAQKYADMLWIIQNHKLSERETNDFSPEEFWHPFKER